MTISIQATKIATVAGTALYEHPRHGDEAPLQIIVAGQLIETPFWETPSAEELLEWRTQG